MSENNEEKISILSHQSQGKGLVILCCIQVLTLCFRDMLKPGGHFIIVDVIDATYYSVNDVQFGVFHTTEQHIKTAFTESGYLIEDFGTKSLGVYAEVAP